jgi:hypothetical protein
MLVPGRVRLLRWSVVRTVEVLAALSLTTDLASGVAFQKGLRTCVLAAAFAERLDVSEDERSTVFHVALLRSIGFTAHDPENAAVIVDDTAFQAAQQAPRSGRPERVRRQVARFGEWEPGRRRRAGRRGAQRRAEGGSSPEYRPRPPERTDRRRGRERERSPAGPRARRPRLGTPSPSPTFPA